jgi:cytochrome c1
MKVTLTISSLVTLVLLLVAAIDETYLTEWRGHQREYRRILLAKARDDQERTLARRFQVEMRQIVVPDLSRVDRCTCCHLGLDDPRMADVAQPFAAHPSGLLDTHDVDAFGCTSCHEGQGWATSKEDAHADEEEVFWERPLLPSPLNQSACGVCHDAASLGERGAPVLARGLALFREHGCRGCHKLGGRGGPHGPPLDKVADKAKHSLAFAHVEGEHTVWNWHVEHLADPQKIVPGSKMPPTEVEDDEMQALTTYLLSLRTTNLTERLTPPDRYEERYRILHPAPLSGAELSQEFCFACHGEGVETILHDTLSIAIPSIRNPDFLAVASEEFLFSNIHDGRPETDMPAWRQDAAGLTDGEIHRLVVYLLDGTERRMVDFAPAPTVDEENGKMLFEENCSACHGVARDADVCCSWLGAPGFQQTFSDALMGHTIKFGREGTLMNPYGEEAGGDLTDKEISDLVAYIRMMK